MSTDGDYRVLARKYRPTSFEALVGQDTLVKTLSNAIQSGRIAHAFMLTGVRGVGKTTTARLIARALNCTGPDGTGQPTMQPCGQCPSCRAIAEDRHPDVIEMDAASRTGVDDVRELIESVRYKPVQARYKIYIIDEVHMLSKQAFNALLKTLEEPPPDIKFVFATTEINKVPITVLSRCQRYTLPRIPAATLADYFGDIARRENVEAEAQALALVARAADGSVRDGLSILDQAIALASGGVVTSLLVRDMLGVADRSLTLDLFETLMQGDAPAALAQLENLYNGGTEPAEVIRDLLDITHALTRLKLEKPGTPPPSGAATDLGDRNRAQALAMRLGVALLTRIWQILLKGLGEVLSAPQPLKAAEMLLVRLMHAQDLPSPADLAKLLTQGGGLGTPPQAGGPADRPPSRSPVAIVGGSAVARVAAPEPLIATQPQLQSFADLLALVEARREGLLYAHLTRHLHLVRFQPGLIEFRPADGAPRDLAPVLSRFVEEATGSRWMVTVSREEGAPTIEQAAQAHEAAERERAAADPFVQAILNAFPGARIESVSGGPTSVPVTLPASLPDEEDEAPELYDPDDPGPQPGEDIDSEAGESA